MSSVQCLRDFVHERLTAAAEEIFRVFEQTVLEYEEEIDRQRRLLDIAWKPEIKLHRTVSELRPPELPEQHVCKEEELLTDQERNPSLDQEDPEPPQIKEEQEEVCTSQEGEQLVLKQEDDTFMLTSPYEGSDHSEPEPTSEEQLLSHISPGAESRAQRGVEHVDPGPTGDEESQRNNSPPIQSPCSTHTGRRASACDTCGKAFRSNSDLKRHMRIHTGERPFSCEICGNIFIQKTNLQQHMRIHTGEKPYLCKRCGKRFRQNSAYRIHERIHTGEKPYTCDVCRRRFSQTSHLKSHMRIHSDRSPVFPPF
ncbi:zinc finger and SCAN domain-containing protein 12-like [Platichthys flesus]|uniref:zinc finger and SCAN domain-containing protein 12-like n=1 Tax=Platichthys flesus TaxID=8260 RepID=UPI002DB969E0|nr:zinc finger and SCAN domain-containing protein 12-like [Platichthys flesus]